jgi:hypothetical protein
LILDRKREKSERLVNDMRRGKSMRLTRKKEKRRRETESEREGERRGY